MQLNDPNKLTRQGVPDLNPRGVNGKRPTCPHYLAPDLVSVDRVLEERDGKKVKVFYCSGCGEERGVSR